MLADFHFLRPLWLLALMPLALLLWSLCRSRHQSSSWQRACDAQLLPYLLMIRSGGNRLPLWLLGLAWLLAVVALAGPTWSMAPRPVFNILNARVIVLDLSQSMMATDLDPSRLVLARYKVADILERSAEGQVGLVVFAGDAFVVSPLTHDGDTITALLPVLEPNIMPAQGSRADLGLLKAAQLLEQAGLSRGDVVLIADASNGQLANIAAAKLRGKGFRVSALAVGTPEGAPIPTRDGFLKDRMGNIVMPELDEEALRALVQAGGGRYVAISTDGHDLDRILDNGVAFDTEIQQLDQETEIWREEGPWLLLLLLLLAALAFRRGWLIALALWVAVVPEASWAFSWADVWLRRDQQVAHALERGDFSEAARLAHEPMQRGIAHYRSGNYGQAVRDFGQVSGADGHYNRGNALARLKRYGEAIAAYNAALAMRPGMEDARFNRTKVEDALRRQQRAQQNAQQSKTDQQRDEPSRPHKQDRQPQSDRRGDNQAQTSSGGGSASEPLAAEARPEEQEQSQGEGDEDAKEAKKSPDSPRDAQRDSAQLAEAANDKLDAEERQALEQWLRRIPDDPGRLLRNKFLFQYRRAGGNGQGLERW